MNERPHRIPSLDGLRAVSISMVMISHLVGTRHFLGAELGKSLVALGDLGVRVFFVISGFLISTLLFRELESRGKIDLPHFYFRRTFRICPPYYAYLFVLMLIQLAGWIRLSPGDAFHAVTYTSNYHPNRSWYVGHTWSLSVEEQFYLFWPLVLVLAGKRRALWGAAVLTLLCPVIRLLLWQYFPATRSGIGHRYETVADSIAVGCLLAGFSTLLGRQPLYWRLLASPLFLLAPAAVLCASTLHEHPRLCFFVGYTVMNLGIVVCIHWCILHHCGTLGRILNSRSLMAVGAMSYSIYLWQQLFLNRYSTALICQFPYNLLMVAVASMASFYLVERPSLRAREWLETRSMGGRAKAGAVRLPESLAGAHRAMEGRRG